MNLYRYFRWLSLDIVLGAIIFLKFLAELYKLSIPGTVYLALAIAIWLIYTVDHLIDSRQLIHSDARREFHRRHRHKIIFFAGIAAVVGLIDIYFLPIEIIRTGTILAACCVMYLMLVYYLPKLWFKEIIVALGYAAGIFLAPLTLLDTLLFIDLVLFFQLVLLAIVNLLVFSVYDKEIDTKNGFSSLAIKWGNGVEKVIWFLLFLMICSALILGVTLQGDYQWIQVAYLIMTCMLLGVMKFPLYFGTNERFRAVGDAVFLVPVIFLFL